MPRTENQKVVTAYLSLELYEKIEAFKLEEDLKSDSKVINTILERWFFGDAPIPAISKTSHLEERLMEVEKICEKLVQQVVGLLHSNTVPHTVLSTVLNTVPDTVPLDFSPTKKGMSQRALARRLKCSHTLIAKLRNLGEIEAYSKQHDPAGVVWEFREGKYYPASEVSGDRQSAIK